MATKEIETSDSDIYEDTEVMPPAGTTAPRNNEVNTIYEPLRLEEGKLSRLHAAATRKEKSDKRRWWIAGAVAAVLLCVGLSLLTVWVAGAAWTSNKPDVITDKDADHQEITELPDTLQAQVENIIQLKFEEMQRALEEKITNQLSALQQKTAAFSVYPSAGITDLDKGAVVPFNMVITDSMNKFDPNEHHYTCPTTGIYYFSLCLNLGRLGGSYEKYSVLALEVGGSNIMRVYSGNNDDDAGDNHYHYDQACNAVIHKCTAGSSVLVKCEWLNSRISQPVAGEPDSILSGFLIYHE